MDAFARSSKLEISVKKYAYIPDRDGIRTRSEGRSRAVLHAVAGLHGVSGDGRVDIDEDLQTPEG